MRMRGAQQVRGARNVHALKIFFVDAGFAKRGSKVNDAVAASQSLSQSSVIEEIAREDLRTEVLQMPESRALLRAIGATQSDDVVSCGECMLDEVTADESACTGNE
jgi:hypothetical protein